MRCLLAQRRQPASKAKDAPADAKAILAEAFASGKISISDFTAAIAALEGGSAKTVEPIEEPIELDVEGTSDLPF